jgi:hypothetical protein
MTATEHKECENCSDISLSKFLLFFSLAFNAILVASTIYSSTRAERERGERRFVESQFHNADERIAELDVANRDYERALIRANHKLGDYYARLQFYEPSPPPPGGGSQPKLTPLDCRCGAACGCLGDCGCGGKCSRFRAGEPWPPPQAPQKLPPCDRCGDACPCNPCPCKKGEVCPVPEV